MRRHPSVIFTWASLVAQLVKNLPAMWRPGFDSWVGKSHGEGKGYLLQYSGLKNFKDCIPWSSMELQRVGYELYLLRAS